MAERKEPPVAGDHGDTVSVRDSPFGLFAGAVVALSLAQYGHEVVKAVVASPFIDFAHNYTFATAVALHLNPYDPAAAAEVDRLLGIRRASSLGTYLPTFYFFAQPLSWLALRPAAVVWCLLNQAALAAALALVATQFRGVPAWRLALVLFVVFTYQPLIEDVVLGQVNALLLLGVTLAWWGMRSARPWLAAIGVAAALNVKPQYGLLLPLLWWLRQTRVALVAVGLFAASVAVSAWGMGPAPFLDHGRYVASLFPRLYAWTSNQSVVGIAYRTVGPFSRDSALALLIVIDAVLLTLVALTVPRRIVPGSRTFDLAWALGLTAIPLSSPLLEEHHLVLLLLPIALIVLGGQENERLDAANVAFVVGLVLVASRYSLEQFAWFHRGAPAALASGKLLGLAVFGASLILRLRARPSGSAGRDVTRTIPLL